MNKYVPRHAIKREKTVNFKKVVAVTLLAATVLGSVVSTNSTSKILLADTARNNKEQNNTQIVPVNSLGAVGANIQTGVLTQDLTDSTGHIYPAGTVVSRFTRDDDASKFSGDFYLALSVQQVMSFPYGEVPAQYVKVTGNKVYQDVGTNGAWGSQSYVTEAGKGETLKLAPDQVDKTALNSANKPAGDEFTIRSEVSYVNTIMYSNTTTELFTYKVRVGDELDANTIAKKSGLDLSKFEDGQAYFINTKTKTFDKKIVVTKEFEKNILDLVVFPHPVNFKVTYKDDKGRTILPEFDKSIRWTTLDMQGFHHAGNLKDNIIDENLKLYPAFNENHYKIEKINYNDEYNNLFADKATLKSIVGSKENIKAYDQVANGYSAIEFFADQPWNWATYTDSQITFEGGPINFPTAFKDKVNYDPNDQMAFAFKTPSPAYQSLDLVSKEAWVSPLKNVSLNYIFKERLGTVHKRYIDENGKELLDTDTIKGWNGDKYNFDTDSAPSINGYKLKEVDNGSGTYSDDSIKNVDFVYYKEDSKPTPKPDNKVTITVNYEDKDGNIIHDPEKLTGNVGEYYQISQLKIDGYEFDNIDGDFDGTFDKDKEVTLTYTKSYKDKTDDNKYNKGKTDDNKYNKVLSKNDTKKLPQTGEAKNTLASQGIILFLITSVLGFVLKYKNYLNK